MAEKSFGAKKIKLDGSGTPTIQSPGRLNLNAVTVDINGNLDVDGGSELDNVNVAGLSTVAQLKMGSITATSILDEDNMASNSAAALATQQSIKAYVDSQVTAPHFAIVKQVESNGSGANPNDTNHQSGSWITRELNTEVDPDGIISLSGDVITIGAGTWMIGWSAPSYYTRTHQTRIQIASNLSFSSDLSTVYGSSEDDGSAYHTGSPPGQTRSMGKHVHVASATSYIRLQHRFEWHTNVHQTNRLGKPTNFTTGDEVYGIVDLWKI